MFQDLGQRMNSGFVSQALYPEDPRIPALLQKAPGPSETGQGRAWPGHGSRYVGAMLARLARALLVLSV